MMARALASASSRLTMPSRLPSENAMPALVVANAWKPDAAKDPGRSGIPWVGHHERCRLAMQCLEGGASFGVVHGRFLYCSKA